MSKIKVILLSSIIFLIIALTYLYISYKFFLNSPIRRDIDLTIPPGTTKTQVLLNLQSDLSLSYVQVLYSKVYLYLNSSTIQFDAGNYSFAASSDLTYAYIFNNLRGGSVQKSITFLEGWRVEENVAELSLSISPNYAKEYYSYAKDKIGYLFPDTYFIDPSKSAQNLVNAQLEEFNDKTQSLFNSYSGDLSKEELVIFASIVEREVRSPEDRKIVAGLLLKRYKEGMPLDADATSQYGLYKAGNSYFVECVLNTSEKCTRMDIVPYWPNVIALEDLFSAGAYNTRGALGLPPTPISNPSLSSLEAVVNPTTTTYYFYLNDLKGHTYYSNTLEEHIANINNYL